MQAHVQHEKVPITSEILVYDSSNFNETKRTGINKVLREHFTPLNIRIIDERFPILTAKDLANRKYHEFIHHELDRKPTSFVICDRYGMSSRIIPCSSSPPPNQNSTLTRYPRTLNRAWISRITLVKTNVFSNAYCLKRLIDVFKKCTREPEQMVKEELRKRMSNDEESPSPRIFGL